MAENTTVNTSMVTIQTSGLNLEGLEQKIGSLFEKHLKSAKALNEKLDKTLDRTLKGSKVEQLKKSAEAFDKEIANRTETAKAYKDYATLLRQKQTLESRGVKVSAQFNQTLANVRYQMAVLEGIPYSDFNNFINSLDQAEKDVDAFALSLESAAKQETLAARQIYQNSALVADAMKGKLLGALESFGSKFFNVGTAATLTLSALKKASGDAKSALANQIPTLGFMVGAGMNFSRSVESLGLTVSEFNETMAGSTRAIYANAQGAITARQALGDWVETIGATQRVVAEQLTGNFVTAGKAVTTLADALASQGAKIPFDQMAAQMGTPADPNSLLGSMRMLSLMTNDSAEAIAASNKELLNEQTMRNQLLTMEKKERQGRLQQLIKEQEYFVAMGKTIQETQQMQRQQAEMTRKPLSRLQQASQAAGFAKILGVGGKEQQLFNLLSKPKLNAKEQKDLSQLATMMEETLAKKYETSEMYAAEVYENTLKASGVWDRLQAFSTAGREGKTLTPEQQAALRSSEVLMSMEKIAVKSSQTLEIIGKTVEGAGIRLAASTIAAFGAVLGKMGIGGSILEGLSGGAGKAGALGRLLPIAGRIAPLLGLLGPIGLAIGGVATILPMFLSSSEERARKEKETANANREAALKQIEAAKKQEGVAGSVRDVADRAADVAKKAADKLKQIEVEAKVKEIAKQLSKPWTRGSKGQGLSAADAQAKAIKDLSSYGGGVLGATEGINKQILDLVEARKAGKLTKEVMSGKVGKQTVPWTEKEYRGKLKALQQQAQHIEANLPELSRKAMNRALGSTAALVKQRGGDVTGIARVQEVMQSGRSLSEKFDTVSKEQQAAQEKLSQADKEVATATSEEEKKRAEETKKMWEEQLKFFKAIEEHIKDTAKNTGETVEAVEENKAAAEAAGRSAALEHACTRVSATR